jgi:hypothetical protein
MMSRLLKLVIAFTLVLSTMSVCAFAATSIDVGTITESSKAVTVNFTVTGAEANDDVTILVYKKDSETAEPTESNIVYINQLSATGSNIQFNLLADAAEGTYEVRMGGTGIETADIGTFTLSSVIYGDVDGNGDIDAFDAVWVLRFASQDTTIPAGINIKTPTNTTPNKNFIIASKNNFLVITPPKISFG